MRAALEAYHAERHRLRGQETARRAERECRIPRLAREIERLVDAICDGTATPASNARLVALEAEKAEMERELGTLDQAARVVDVHPGAIQAYTRAVEDLEHTLAAGPAREAEAVALIRRLVEKIVVVPPASGRPLELRVHGRLAELLTLPERNARRTSSIQVVAGEGLEPPTLGL